jgi:HEAT repeat protein
MRLRWIQVISVSTLVFIGGYGALASRSESEARLALGSPQPEHKEAEKLSAPPFQVESLIDEAIKGTSAHASDAAAQLAVAGCADPKIVALLLKRLESVKGRPATIAILARIGDRVAPQAIALLNDDRAEVRWSVLRLLLCLDNLPPTITPQIARCLKDEDVWVRRWAAMLLGRIDNEACVSDLMMACKDDDAEVRWRALRALHRGGSLSDLPEGVFRDALADTDPDVRYVASQLSRSTVVDRQP